MYNVTVAIYFCEYIMQHNSDIIQWSQWITTEYAPVGVRVHVVFK
jgi:hypothetical protein